VTGSHRPRLSLAGVQDKLPVRRDDDGSLWLPVGGAPSTHILKVPSRDFKHLPANEALVTRLAHRASLVAVDVELVSMEGVQIAVVQRYDRRRQDGAVVRLHQEDLCQALGLMPGTKYEHEGGPSFADAMSLVRSISTDPLRDAQQLLRWLCFCLLVGNADGHGKNLSLLYEVGGDADSIGGLRLAPFYDLVCTRAYPNIDRRCAMGIGPQHDPGQISRRHWEGLARAVGVGARVVLQEVEQLAIALPNAVDQIAADQLRAQGESPVIQRVRQVIHKQCRRSLQLL
jgi:serine/threonine-protein kinase HipA